MSSKEYHREYSKKWNQKNREKVLKRMKKYNKEIKEISLEIGNCYICHKNKSELGFKSCIICRNKQRIYQNKLNRKLKNDK